MYLLKQILKRLIRSCAPLQWELMGFYYRITEDRAMSSDSLRSTIAGPSSSTRQGAKRIAFVTSWYGEGISGGAEAECYGLVEGLAARDNGLDVEVLTTTLKEFSSDWNESYHAEGDKIEGSVRVHRFSVTTPDRRSFHILNGSRLMKGGVEALKARGNASPVSANVEAFYARSMIHSPKMLRFIEEQIPNFDLFVFIPYMFGPTIFGGRIAATKAVIIPCLHDERYAYMDLYKSLMTSVKATAFHVEAELNLAKKIYGSKLARPYLIGEKVQTDIAFGDSQRFLKKFGIEQPYLLYAGRKIVGKNLPELVQFFSEFKRRFPSDLRLVIIGKGDLNFVDTPHVTELGFLDEADKIDAYRGALALCQPSLNESFSIVMMEAWLQETPNLVHSGCDVTADHINASGGGYLYRDQQSFNEQVLKLSAGGELNRKLGAAGRRYVLQNFSPDVVLTKVEAMIDDLTKAGVKS
jgi:glycosyltransferase involved in cell wall biosynthesis